MPTYLDHMDLKSLSLPELRKLSLRIEGELKKRSGTARADMRKRFQQLAREHGLTLEEVLGQRTEPSPTRRRAAPAQLKPASKPKYRHPSDQRLVWSGRGRKPAWVEAWLAGGGGMDALAIAAEKMAARP